MDLKQILNISIILLSLGLIPFGCFLIGSVCFYTSTAGPMNFDFTFISSLLGLILLVVGVILLKVKLKKIGLVLRLYFITLSILLFIFGAYVSTESKKKLEARYEGVEGPDIEELGGINKMIFYSSCFGLFFYGMLSKEEKKPYKYLDNKKYD